MFNYNFVKYPSRDIVTNAIFLKDGTVLLYHTCSPRLYKRIMGISLF